VADVVGVFDIDGFRRSPLAVGRANAHAPPERFQGIDEDSDTADPAAFLGKMTNRNAAFQSCPVHTGPGSKPGHCHVKPKNRNMEETFNKGFLIIYPIPQRGAKVKFIMSIHQVSRIDNNSLTMPRAGIKGNTITDSQTQPCKTIIRRASIMRAKNPAIDILPWLYRLLRWSLGSITIYSGVTKLSAPITFAVLIDAYGLVPDILPMPLAVAIFLLEVLAGAGLMLDLRGRLDGKAGIQECLPPFGWGVCLEGGEVSD
jgi:hypothetical protein